MHWIQKTMRVYMLFFLGCTLTSGYENTSVVIPGDVYIAGLFDIHDNLQGSCGEIRVNAGFLYSEAFIFALDKINSKTGLFKNLGVRIGGLGFDTCRSIDRTEKILMDIQDGTLVIEGVTFDEIGGVIGPSSSTYSSRVHQFLKRYNVTQISYASTSTMFKDTEKYPYFLTTVPLDDKQAKAMTKMLHNVKWTNVLTLSDNYTYGLNGVEAFKTEAEKLGICVEQSFVLDKDGSPAEVVDKILKATKTPVVVTFTDFDDAIKIMRAFHETENTCGDFVLIGSEAWADSEAIVEGVEQSSDGLITMNILGSEIPGFVDAMKQKRYGQYPTNPYFDAYYEDVMKCGERYQNECTNDTSITPDMYELDIFATHVTIATYAMALGIHQVLTSVCGQGYSGICSDFKMTEQREKIFQFTKDIKFNDITGTSFEFIGNQGNQGYEILRYHGYPLNRRGYKRIGKYSNEELQFTTLTAKGLTDTYYKDIVSECSSGAIVTSSSIVSATALCTLLAISLGLSYSQY
ncbi:unnamed protein product [Owenia fusiformis]|uniref:Receptor ligand binding region domain-containing protein n=1 Tax=Owenia fusiformis TaxID=6347 RepID=A0A8S4NMR7_OWEFU|nr:unnamed protein product [Owenia fusiformis]